MKTTIKIALLLAITIISSTVKAQTALPNELLTSLKADDATALEKLLTKENLNTCYKIREGQVYTLLSLAIHEKKTKWFELLMAKGADVNVACDYRSPLIHAAKYGTLEVVKALIAKGAKLDYVAADGKMTALSQAELFGQPGVLDYLKSLKK